MVQKVEKILLTDKILMLTNEKPVAKYFCHNCVTGPNFTSFIKKDITDVTKFF